MHKIIFASDFRKQDTSMHKKNKFLRARQSYIYYIESDILQILLFLPKLPLFLHFSMDFF